jgi:putative glutamine amidotransferase
VKAIATWVDEASKPFFKWVFANYPDLRIYDVRIEPAPPWEEVGGLMLTGGSDISEKFLRQPVPDPSLIKNPDMERDIWEFDVVQKALRQRMPILAICRGHQVLNVALGGTLHLDIPGHSEPQQKSNNVQELRFADVATFSIPAVNSSHHQVVDKLGDGLKVEAWCKADDVIEQMHLVDYPFAFSVQYHPERDPLYLPIFNAFAQAVRQGAA